VIQAVIFDLDGTLVQSERLKAISYGRAIRERLDLAVPDERIFELYKEVVGQTRDVVSGSLVEALGLEECLRSHMAAYGAAEPRQVLTAMRLQIYAEMVADPQLLRDNQWPHNVALLRIVRAAACRTALATSSLTEEARYVLRALSLEEEFEAVVGVDQVERGKPDPEIYLLAASLLDVPPADCLVIEDSPIGVQAALAAGMSPVAVATPFTYAGLHAAGLLDHDWLVHEPADLLATVARRLAAHGQDHAAGA
jgi:HAD superfamily hydrolase (TIGR01509 family)